MFTHTLFLALEYFSIYLEYAQRQMPKKIKQNRTHNTGLYLFVKISIVVQKDIFAAWGGVRHGRAAADERQHRPQDGERAAAGARAARRGAARGRPAAALGPAIHAAAPRGVRRRRQARCHLPQGARHPEQTDSRKVPKAER
ncbi:unnamed protein product [Pieris macdunnoughi]|uniref:Uncharacterized protein n=1 Tax=Pieris macdunnoughi TaxID=345717 RepID=A0A821SCM5_9NEOP|nr:unnamed protein product [Pieris macdunnoughi]